MGDEQAPSGLPIVSGPGQATPFARADSAGKPTELSILEPGSLVGGFRIGGVLGIGGMGVVYEAFENRLQRDVALKMLHPHLASDEAFAKRFRQEAILAANLRHPSIVPVFSVDENDPPRFFTMQIVHSYPLADFDSEIHRVYFTDPRYPYTGGCFSLRDILLKCHMSYRLSTRALDMCSQVCDALGYAHSKGIIHRDIKPSNILLEGSERWKVTDFGIVQALSGRLAEQAPPGYWGGTLPFMSPEQNAGAEVDHRTDIYSLGMTIYFALTGRTAYDARTRPELAEAFRNQKPQPPSRVNPAVSKKLDAAVLRMIDLDPGRRFQSCLEAADAIEAAS